MIEPKDLTVVTVGARTYLQNKLFLFEPKLDGFRALATSRPPRILSRNDTDMSFPFPEIIVALAALPPCVLDAELLVMVDGKSDFSKLQKRFRQRRPAVIAMSAESDPATLFAFDLLELRGKDLRDEPIEKRKEKLRKLLATGGPVAYLPFFPDGEALYQSADAQGFEGVVCKRRGSPYRGGRSPDWFKIKTRHGRHSDELRSAWNK